MSPTSFDRISQCWFNSSKVSKIVKKLIEENKNLKNYKAPCFENTPLFAANSLLESNSSIEKSCLIQNTWIEFFNKTIIRTFSYRKKLKTRLQATGKRAFLLSERPVW